MKEFGAELVGALAPVVGEATANVLSEELGKMAADAEDPLNKAHLSMMTNAMKEHGAVGIQSVITAVTDLSAGKQVDLTKITDLETASDLLAVMQNQEADRREAANDMLTQIGKSLGVVTSALVSGLILK